MRSADFFSHRSRFATLDGRPSDGLRATCWILAAVTVILLATCAALGDNGEVSASGSARREAQARQPDWCSLRPPAFPLDSPLAQRRFWRIALYECAYREGDLRLGNVGNNSFDYPDPAYSQAPASGSPSFDLNPATGADRVTPPALSAPLSAPPISPYTPPGPPLSYTPPDPSLLEQASGLSFYARADYYYWRESRDRYRLLEESGPLVTLGFTTQRDDRRLRAEVFGGQVQYDGATMDDDPLKINTNYLGGRIQYDLLWPFQHDPNSAFVLGLGTRLWNRSLLDGVSESGYAVTGYDEFWWMLYPMVGLETRRPMGSTSHWFASASLGITGFTYERIADFDVTLYPKMGPMVQVEWGIQTPRLFVSLFLEVMQFYASNSEATPLALLPVYQPDSMRLTAGLNAGIHF